LPAIEKLLTEKESADCPTCLGIGISGVGLLNSYVFMGLFVGSMIATVALQKFAPRKILALMCVLNFIINFIFAITCINKIFGEGRRQIDLSL